MFWSPADERIYVRLARGRYQARLGCQVPADVDPRATPLFLFGDDSVLELAGSAAHLRLEGLQLAHGEIVVDMAAGSHHVTLRRCGMRAGRYEVVARGGHDLVFDGLVVHGGFPPWVARSDVKRPDPGRPAHLYFEVYEAAVAADSFAHYDVDITVTDSTARGFLASVVRGVQRVVGGGVDRTTVQWERAWRPEGDRAVEYVSLELAGPKTGTYVVTVKLRDRTSGQTATAERRFRVVPARRVTPAGRKPLGLVPTRARRRIAGPAGRRDRTPLVRSRPPSADVAPSSL